jgi:hypothetical protein
VEFILENSAGEMVGIEVKSTASVTRRDFQGLEREASAAGSASAPVCGTPCPFTGRQCRGNVATGLDHRPIRDIKAPELFSVLRRVE